MSRATALFTSVVALSVLVLVAGCGPQAEGDDDASLLYVLSATSGSFESDVLILEGVPTAAYFSERPERLTGHTDVREFVALWDEGDESFSNDPPNAYLAIVDQTGDSDIVLELERVESSGDAIEFSVTLLEGMVPATFGQTTLFIDAFPTSVNSQITD